MKNENLSADDQGMVDLIKDNYQAPDLGRMDGVRFDEKLSARISKSQGLAWGPWALAFAMVLVFVAVGVNQKRPTPSMPEAAITAVEEGSFEDLEWFDNLVDEDELSVEFEELPEEYVAMMMIMDSDSDEYDDY